MKVIRICFCCGNDLKPIGDEFDDRQGFCAACCKAGCPNDPLEAPCRVTGKKHGEDE